MRGGRRGVFRIRGGCRRRFWDVCPCCVEKLGIRCRCVRDPRGGIRGSQNRIRCNGLVWSRGRSGGGRGRRVGRWLWIFWAWLLFEGAVGEDVVSVAVFKMNGLQRRNCLAVRFTGNVQT